MPKANRRNSDDMIGCDRSSVVVSQPIIAASSNFVALTLAISQIIIGISHTDTMPTAASDSYNYLVVPKYNSVLVHYCDNYKVYNLWFIYFIIPVIENEKMRDIDRSVFSPTSIFVRNSNDIL